jgi:hypothetical protein
MKQFIQSAKSRAFIIAVTARICLTLLPKAQAVVPAPDGGYPGGNTAEGQTALFSLTTGGFNTAIGYLSLRGNTLGNFNTGVGAGTLLANTGVENTATGAGALLGNTAGAFNTANGALALFSNNMGESNTAAGVFALFSNTTGHGNTAFGQSALRENSTGGGNTAIGSAAGLSITGAGNVCIGQGVFGVAGVHNTTWIRNVYPSVATTRAVYVDSDGKLGTLASSRRFKDEIKAMDKTSEAILVLKPVTFRYKQEIDSSRAPQFGLVAEDVAKVNPDLVLRDEKGEIFTVRYEAVNAMLLNEFLKEHRKVEDLKNDFRATVSRHQKEIAALTATVKEQAAQIQKVIARFEANEPRSRTVLNNP